MLRRVCFLLLAISFEMEGGKEVITLKPPMGGGCPCRFSSFSAGNLGKLRWEIKLWDNSGGEGFRNHVVVCGMLGFEEQKEEAPETMRFTMRKPRAVISKKSSPRKLQPRCHCNRRPLRCYRVQALQTQPPTGPWEGRSGLSGGIAVTLALSPSDTSGWQ